jgi:hypothetical protein
MNLLFQNTDTPEIILKVIQKVGDKLTNACPYFSEVRDAVYVVVDTEKSKLQTKLQESSSLSDGFAHVESNYYLREEDKNVFVTLIVLYHQNCIRTGLTEDEIAAVILHELGHLINDSTDEPVPSVMDSIRTGQPFDPDAAARIKDQNALARECYADHYARMHGFGNEVANALMKHYQVTSTSPTKMALERIAVLSSPTVEEMQGTVKIMKNK